MLVSVRGRFQVNGGSDLDETTDQIMNALLRFESLDPAVSDSDVSAELAPRLVTISVVVEADSWELGNERGRATIRAAIEATNGHVADPPEVQNDTASFRFVTQAESAELVPA